jgi:hypothetical protein
MFCREARLALAGEFGAFCSEGKLAGNGTESSRSGIGRSAIAAGRCRAVR